MIVSDRTMALLGWPARPLWGQGLSSKRGRRDLDPQSSWKMTDSGVTRLQWARVQVFQKGPLFPKKLFKKQRRVNFGPPTALGPRALHALHALLLRH